MLHLRVLSETLRHPDVRIALRFDVLDVERHNFRVGSRRANLVNPRLRISAVDDDERIHRGEMVAAVLLETVVAGNIVEEKTAWSVLEPSDDFDLRHDSRHVRFHDKLADIHARQVTELGFSDARVADNRNFRWVVHFVFGGVQSVSSQYQIRFPDLVKKLGLKFLLILSTARRVCLTSTIINLTCVRTIVCAIFYYMLAVPTSWSFKFSPTYFVLIEAIVADAKRCITRIVHADTPHRNINITSLALHFGGTVSILKILNPF